MLRYYKILYWIATIAISGIMLYSATLYFTKTEMIEGFFESFNYPTYIVIPLAIAKILGVAMIIYRKPLWLAEWAYAGFFFDLILAFFGHLNAGHNLWLPLIALLFLLLSYFSGKKVRNP
ncbi:MAG: DoxX family protein [Aquaticitalea sp.]